MFRSSTVCVYEGGGGGGCHFIGLLLGANLEQSHL